MNAKESADRVKTLLKQGSSFQGQDKGESLRSHTCTAVKTPRVPELLYVLFPSLFKKISDRKTDAVTAQWNEGSKQANEVGSHVESSKTPGADLIPTRVKRWKIKEYQGIARRIKALSKYKPVTHSFQIEALNEKAEAAVRSDTTQDQLWQEMMKSKEERQFQIGRITKYFS